MRMKTIEIELKKLIPVVLFFFVCYTLVEITEIVIHKEKMQLRYDFAVIAIGSLIMGKVVLLSDYLPFISIFSKKPLIYGTVWKTCIYVLMSMCIRLIERCIPFLFDDVAWQDTSEHLRRVVEGFPFWLGQMWLFVLLFIFVAYRELIIAVGPDRVRRLFFGAKK